MSRAPSTDPHRLGPLLARALAGDPVALNDLLATLRPYLHLLVRQQRGPGRSASGSDTSRMVRAALR